MLQGAHLGVAALHVPQGHLGVDGVAAGDAEDLQVRVLGVALRALRGHGAGAAARPGRAPGAVPEQPGAIPEKPGTPGGRTGGQRGAIPEKSGKIGAIPEKLGTPRESGGNRGQSRRNWGKLGNSGEIGKI